MPDGEITIVSVSWRSGRYLRRLLPGLVDRAADPSRLRFLVVDNTNGEDSEMAALLEGSSLRVLRHRPQARGSLAHASGLDAAMPHVETEWTLVVDPDVAILTSQWDELALETLQRTGAPGFGAPYPAWKLGKYHDFPSPIFGLHRTSALRELGAGWSPFPTGLLRRGINKVARNTVRLGGLANRKRLLRYPRLFTTTRWLEGMTGVTAPDVGWQLAASARSRGLHYTLLDFLNPRDSAPFGPAMERLAATFEVFTLDGSPYVAHKYTSANRIWGVPGSGNVALWESLTDSLMLDENP